MTIKKTNGRCFDCNQIKNLNRDHYSDMNRNISKVFANFSDGVKDKFSCFNALSKNNDKNTNTNVRNMIKNIISSLYTQNSNFAKFIFNSHSVCLSRRRLFCTPISNLSKIANFFPNQTISSFKYSDLELTSIASSFINYTIEYSNFFSKISSNYSLIIDTLLNSSLCKPNNSTKPDLRPSNNTNIKS